MNILVTGGYGFKGSNFIRYVETIDDVDVIINIDNITSTANTKNVPRSKKIKHFTVDLNNRDVLANIIKNYQITHVGHFAELNEINTKSNLEFHKTNISSTINLLEVCSTFSNVKKVFYSSTSNIYGDLKLYNNKITEASAYNPIGSYATSKAACNIIVKDYFNRVPVIIGNSCNVFGPNQNKLKFIPNIISSALNNTTVPVYGLGLNIRDWLYVEDYCHAVWRLLVHESVNSDEYNITSSNELSNLQIIELLCTIFNKKPETFVNYVTDIDNHIIRNTSCNSKLIGVIGEFVYNNLLDALQRTVNYQSQLSVQ